MSKRHLACLSLVLALWLLTATSYSVAGGLSTQLGEVVIENLQIGQRYNLQQLANLRLPVTNTSGVGVRLKIDVLVPQESELRHKAGPIAQDSWVELSDTLFEIDAGETIEADIYIQVPNDEQYLGKKFQAMIWSHTIPGEESGMFMAVGLKSRLIFTVDTVRAETVELTGVDAAAPEFLLEPAELVAKDVRVGEKYDLREDAGTGLRLTNTSNETHTFRVMSKTTATSTSSLITGYLDAPSASYLSFNQTELTLESGESRELAGYLLFPASEEFAAKKYMFIVHVSSVGKQISSGKYSRVLVTLK